MRLELGSPLSWVLALGTTAVGLALLFWPADYLPSMLDSVWDKLPHVGLFFVLTLVWLGTGLGLSRVMVVMLLLVVGTEVGQEVLPIGRAGDVADGLADGVGVVLALVAVAMVVRWRRGANPSGPKATG